MLIKYCIPVTCIQGELCICIIKVICLCFDYSFNVTLGIFAIAIKGKISDETPESI